MTIKKIGSGFPDNDTKEQIKANVHNNLDLLGMMPAGKSVSFKAFKEKADATIYGRAHSGLYIVYIGHPKENTFAFYPRRGSTKAEALKFAYEEYKAMIEGDMYGISVKQVVWCNTGHPLSYGMVRAR